jgi:hypothetical protein
MPPAAFVKRLVSLVYLVCLVELDKPDEPDQLVPPVSHVPLSRYADYWISNGSAIAAEALMNNAD